MHTLAAYQPQRRIESEVSVCRKLPYTFALEYTALAALNRSSILLSGFPMPPSILIALDATSRFYLLLMARRLELMGFAGVFKIEGGSCDIHYYKCM